MRSLAVEIPLRCDDLAHAKRCFDVCREAHGFAAPDGGSHTTVCPQIHHRLDSLVYMGIGEQRNIMECTPMFLM
jgi:hypothetical protein